MAEGEKSTILEFEGFRLDPARRLLTGPDGAGIDLKPRVFDTLVVLVEQAGRVVSKDDLMSAVWPGVTVEENNLNQAISSLRKALGDGAAGKRLIVTVPGRGYQFAATVREAGETPDPPAAARVESTRAEAKPARMGRPNPALPIGGVLAAAVLVAVVVWFALRPPADPASAGERIAFFGFSAEDAAVADVARSATDETYAGLQTTGALLVARSDALAQFSGPRLDRAKKLGATYALSGEVRPEPRTNRVSISARVEEVATRTILFEENYQGDAAAPLPLAIEAASMSTQVAACLATARQAKGAPAGRDWIPAMAAWCSTQQRGDMSSVRSLRELTRVAPDMAFGHAALAMMLGYNLPVVGASTQPGLLAEAREALARAESLDDREFMLAAARYLLGTIDGEPLIKLEADFKSRLQRPPKGQEVRSGYQNANLFYGSLLQRTGRIRESVPIYKAGADANPFSTGAIYNYVNTLALIGNGEAQDRFELAFDRYPSMYVWEQWIRSAVLLGIGDADAMLAQPPAPVSDAAAQCWRDIRDAVRSQKPAARADGAVQVKACKASGLITQASAMCALSTLGDLDGAFALSTGFSTRDTPASLFWPPTGSMRADPRFLPVVEKLGLMDYWRATKTRPDVCETETAPFCAQIAEATKNQ